RDLAGAHAYHLALAAFLSTSLLAYFLLCHLSPSVLTGAARVLGNKEAGNLLQDVPYPLYIAALFMGLTQPIIPGFSKFEVAQRVFFHGRIEVPRRIIDFSESVISAIKRRSNDCVAIPRHVPAEVRIGSGGPVAAGADSLAHQRFSRFRAV